MPSIDVNPDDLTAAASKLREAVSYADMASQYSTEADPEWWMWGLPGVVTAPIYFALADGWRDLLAETGQAIEGLSQRLEDSCNGYVEIDSVVGEEFGSLLTDLSGAYNDYKDSTQNPPMITTT
ncbi:hypothetical protein [Glycomyces niveus]|jgi:hypothetical protein|uniref:ESX-1 secretion-associated protein n=1 Tax=Glycomyces niveus TaxID=2820287 RepID=A0ABS3U9Y1_9ACTN|nr:hypothetical protein [Glycomyces sp. NEAU-S30]MBO3735591.1 hypothetical protein [Glycomyces sp. NEAU-S30]